MNELILDLVRRKVEPTKVRYVSSAKGGEWHSPCPMCGGDDRFHIWPDQDGGQAARTAGQQGTWWCRKCDKGGDIIALVMAMDGCDFKSACQSLQIEMQAPTARRLAAPKTKPGWTPQTWKIPAEVWRKQAGKMATAAHERLLAYPQALEYLAGRGLPLAAVQRYRLGWLAPEDKAGKGRYRARSAFGLADRVDKAGKKHTSLWVPAGISIPLWADAAADTAEPEALRIRIRRRKGDLRPADSKYMLLEGSGSDAHVAAATGHHSGPGGVGGGGG